MNRKLLILIGLTSIIFLGLMVTLLFSDSHERSLASDLTNEGIVFGSSEAPYTVIEFSNFGCNYCKQQHEEIAPFLKDKVASGEIYYIFKPVTISHYEKATELTKLLKPSMNHTDNWRIIDSIFKDQDKWKLKSMSQLTSYSEKYQFKKGETIELNKLDEEAEQVKLDTVPTIFINGERLEGVVQKEDLNERFK